MATWASEESVPVVLNAGYTLKPAEQPLPFRSPEYHSYGLCCNGSEMLPDREVCFALFGLVWFFFSFCFFVCLFFEVETGSHYVAWLVWYLMVRLDWPGTQKRWSASASGVLGIKTCVTMSVRITNVNIWVPSKEWIYLGKYNLLFIYNYLLIP